MNYQCRIHEVVSTKQEVRGKIMDRKQEIREEYCGFVLNLFCFVNLRYKETDQEE
jgi:hypothetical protein